MMNSEWRRADSFYEFTGENSIAHIERQIIFPFVESLKRELRRKITTFTINHTLFRYALALHFSELK
jgi:hypothetical protein